MSIRYLKNPNHIGKRFGYWLLSLVLMPIWTAMAQVSNPSILQCGTESLSPADRKILEAEAAQALQAKIASGFGDNTITYVPIRPHIIRRANGTGGYSMASLNNVMALTNKYYLQNGTGIQFYLAGTSPDYIDNDALYNQFRYVTDDATVAPRDATNALNQYYVNQFNTNLGGYAYYPANNVSSTRSFILNENNDSDMGNRLVPHELGHTLNLIHTFDSAYGYERVTRNLAVGANCTTAGDLLCDTPADPYGMPGANSISDKNGCVIYDPASTARDANGDAFSPSTPNIMSYYLSCTHDFTPGQYDRMQAGLALRQSHTTYTLDAPATAMSAPSNVMASIQNYRVIITWQDNASNEMGYFIERSTSPTTGFVPIGGVAPDITSFTDLSATPYIQYYYRIKGSNTMAGSISSTATVVAPACRPTFTGNGCQFGVTITGVVVNGTTLSENSGCSPSNSDYYTSFTAVSGTVTAGQSASFTVTKGTTDVGMGGTIWVDLNNNGVFETSERLYQTPNPYNEDKTFSGTLAIPASVTANIVAMRIVAGDNYIPNNPCGNYLSYGETEDYILVVIPACKTPISTLKDGNWDDPTVWSCNQVPSQTDLVQVGHAITIPNSFVARALRIEYSSGGLLTLDDGAQLFLEPWTKRFSKKVQVN